MFCTCDFLTNGFLCWEKWLTISRLWINLLFCGLLYTDLQLDVKGCKNVYESFDKYVEVERLEGENKYQAEQFGLQVGSSLENPFGSLFILVVQVNSTKVDASS